VLRRVSAFTLETMESLSRDDHAAPTFSIKDGEEEVLIRLSDIENLIKALNRLKELTSV